MDDLKALQGKFAIFSRRGWWKICCYDCNREWRLEKSKVVHPGNLLHLLNHYAGHELKRNDPEEWQRIQDEQREATKEALERTSRILSRMLRE